MKTKIILTILLLTVIGCKSQIKIGNNMEHFNIDKFRENNAVENEKISTAENGDKIQQFSVGNNNGYVERIENAFSPFELYKEYYQTGSLKVKVNLFYNFQINIREEYDNNGNLIKKTNNDKDYKFSIQELAKKMKENYSIDILQKSRWVKVMRENIDSLAVYRVMVYVKENKYSDTKNYIIDGTTGKLISEKIISYPKE